MRRRLSTLFFLITILAPNLLLNAAESIYLYVLPFENIKNDPNIDWLRQGFADMLSVRMGKTPSLAVKSQVDLEHIMSNRNLLLHQPRGTRNFLLLGKYELALDQVKVGLQLVDIATWEEVSRRSTTGKLGEIPELHQLVAESIETMLKPFLPEVAVTPVQEEPVAALPATEAPRPQAEVRQQVAETGKSIDVAIDQLEHSMDMVVNIPAGPVREEPVEEAGEWVLDFTSEDFTPENPVNKVHTDMLVKVLNDLTENPYQVAMSRPRFEYDKESRSIMEVVFPVTFALKEHLIRDMLTSLPYSGLKQDGSLTVFYFNRDNFNFPADLTDRIKFGRYRATPVIRFYDAEGNVRVVIVDSPDAAWQTMQSDKVLFIAEHYFSPLIVFTSGGWSLQVAMETVKIPVKYRFNIEVDKVTELTRVSLKFVPEAELPQFLQPYL